MDTYTNADISSLKFLNPEVEWRLGQVILDFLLEAKELGVHHIGIEEIEDILEMVDTGLCQLLHDFLGTVESISILLVRAA